MENTNPIQPPGWPLKLLRFFLKKEYVEEIEGDMEEIFYDAVEVHSVRRARWMYVGEVFRLLRPGLMRNMEAIHQLNQLSMFKNYFKVSLRGLVKNPVNATINIFGLSAAIGFCLFAYAFARWTMDTDQFHEHKESVCLTTFSANREGSTQQYGTTPRPIGEMLRKDFAHITNVCRIDDHSVIMKFDDNVFHERVRFVDPEFLEVFTFPLKWGTSSSLKDANSIILSERMSVKYFGDQNPIGETILMIFGENRSKAFKITGVAKEFPKAKSFAFDFLVNFENLKTYDPAYDVNNWNEFLSATFIQVDANADLSTLRIGMDKYRKLQNASAKPEWAITSFSFAPLTTLHKDTEYIRDDIATSAHSNYVSIVFMSVIGALLLALACFNYINIAIASAAKRLKEIGVRKSIGATRKVVVVQFLSENIVITGFALIFGVVFGMTFFIPGFELLWNFSMDFKLTEPTLWIFLLVLLVITSVASGIYPSIYISRFQVVTIMRGTVKFGQRNPVAKTLLCIQLILCCVFITCSVLFTQNTNYLANRTWGYNNAQAMYATVPDQLSYEKLATEMGMQPDVISVAGASHHVGKKNAAAVIHFPGRDFETDLLSVDARYFETLGLQLQEGRGFNDQEGSDSRAVIINESFVKSLEKWQPGWETAVGRIFRIDTTEYTVVGVVRDFHNYNFDVVMKPMVFTVAGKADYRYVAIKAEAGSEMKTYKTLQATWAKLFPEVPFEGGLQQDVWGFYYEEIAIYNLVWKVIAFLAVALATLGLYGLIRLNVTGRVKEFSIRKVLGAGVKNIAASITRQYTFLFATALLIGAPAGYMLSKWLIEFASFYHMPVTFSGVSIGMGIMITVLLLTVSTQIRKVSRANPLDGLKTE